MIIGNLRFKVYFSCHSLRTLKFHNYLSLVILGCPLATIGSVDGNREFLRHILSCYTHFVFADSLKHLNVYHCVCPWLPLVIVPILCSCILEAFRG